MEVLQWARADGCPWVSERTGAAETAAGQTNSGVGKREWMPGNLNPITYMLVDQVVSACARVPGRVKSNDFAVWCIKRYIQVKRESRLTFPYRNDPMRERHQTSQA